jgi:hypothetical protein
MKTRSRLAQTACTANFVLFLLFISIFAYSDEMVAMDEKEEVVDINQLASEKASDNTPPNENPRLSLTAKDKNLRFHFFGDLSLVATSSCTGSHDEAIGFTNQHAFLFMFVDTGNGVRAATELVNLGDFFEITVDLAYFFPNITHSALFEKSNIKFGNILVPFGEYKYHHLYGGTVEASRKLMSNFWTDLGMSVMISFLPSISVEWYVLNGLRFDGSEIILDSGGLKDSNLGKSVGMRTRLESVNGFLTLSLLYDHFSTEQETGIYGNAILFGIDSGYRFGLFQLNVGAMRANVKATTFSNMMSGWYVEGKYLKGQNIAIRFRTGQVDPDFVTEDGDTSSILLGITKKVGLFDIDFSYTLARATNSIFSSWNARDEHKVTLGLYFML